MRESFLGVMLLLTACASARAQTTAADNRAGPSSTFGTCVGTNSVIVANNCSGATLGLKVNAADAALGNNAGDIWVYGGGNFGDENSRITISSNHTLRVFPGTYTSTGYYGVIVLNNDSALICEDPSNTILQEPTHAPVASADMWEIVAASGVFYTSPGTLIPYPNRNISVKGCRFKGARTDYSANFSLVAMANCHNCEVSGNVFDTPHAISVYYGLVSNAIATDPLGLGQYAEASSIHDNLVIGNSVVALALTNGQDIRINNNTCIRSNLGLSNCIDLEPNVSTDRIVGVSVSNNFINMEGSNPLYPGDGISISNGAGVPSLRYRGILVENNKIDGAAASTTNMGSRLLRVGINIHDGAMDVQVRNNTIRFAYNSAIYNNGSRVFIQGNSIFGSNNSGFPIHLDTASSESVVSGNWVYCNTSLTDVCSTKIQNDGATSNVISGNLRSGAPTIAAGTGAGTGPTISITGDDISGYITLTTGSAPSASATVATITYANNHGNVPVSIPLSPGGPNAAALSGRGQVYVDLSASNSASFLIKVGATRLAARTTYQWFYGPVMQ